MATRTIDERLVRWLAAALGLSVAGFGAVPLVSPRAFGRFFGIKGAEEPAAAATFRSAGMRDVALGLGLWSAASRGGTYAPWLLARVVCDAGDVAALLLAVRAGARDRRLLALTGLAAGATAGGAALYAGARHTAVRR